MPTMPSFFHGSWGLNLSPHVCATRNLPTETSLQPLSLECEHELPLEEPIYPRVLTSPNLRKTLSVKRCAEGEVVPQGAEQPEQKGSLNRMESASVLGVCLCVCMHVCMPSCMNIHECTCADMNTCGNQRETCRVIPQSMSPLCFETELLPGI